MQQKIKSGRPRKIDQIWNEELKKKVLAKYKAGAFSTEIILMLDISDSLFYELMKGVKTDENNNIIENDLSEKELDFMETIKKGMLASQVFWENELKSQATGTEFNKLKDEHGTVIDRIGKKSLGANIFILCNRANKNPLTRGWTNKQEIENTGEPVQANVNITADSFKKVKDLKKELDEN